MMPNKDACCQVGFSTVLWSVYIVYTCINSLVIIHCISFLFQIKTILDDIVEKLPDEFNMHEIQAKVPPEERTPYVIVAFQECERMNILTTELKRSLKELDLGLKVSTM